MSLVAFGMRVALVRIIRLAVWSEFGVLDSPQAPIDLVEDGKPLIAVYTGQDNDRMAGRDVLGGEPTVSVTIQIFLPAEVDIEVAGRRLSIDTRKSGAETVLDVLARRIGAGILGQADDWSRLFFDLVMKTGRTTNASYLVETAKVRTSAREITLLCDTIHEPVPGAPPGDVWAGLVALMQADPELKALAPWIAAEIAGPTILAQAERDRIDLGLSEYAAQAVAIVPGPPEDVAEDDDATDVDELVVADALAP